jgi:hypothetical protein
MPFGLASAPRIWTKLMGAVLEPLRVQGIRLTYYIDDIWLLASSLEEATRQATIVRTHLETLGFIIHPTKCDWTPQQVLSRHNSNGITPTYRQDPQDSQGGQQHVKTFQGTDSYSQDSSTNRSMQLDLSGGFSDPLQSLVPDSRHPKGPSRQWQQLEQDHNSIEDLSSRPTMVDRRPFPMEWQNSTDGDPRHRDRDRCQRPGLGLRSYYTESEYSDQRQILEGTDNTHPHRQHDDSSIYQQTRGNNSPSSRDFHTDPHHMSISPNPPFRRISPRCREHTSRLLEQNEGGS